MTPLDALIAPRSVAVVGASNDPVRIGGRPLQYLRTLGFAGAVYPVNPQREQVQGLRAYPSVQAIGQPVDCAVVAVPAGAAPAAVADCAAAGVKAVVVFSAGFAELGEAGAAAQAEMVRTARAAGMRLLGPNCMGAYNAATAAYLTFTGVVGDADFRQGRTAMVTQSGGYGSAVIRLAHQRGLVFNHWVTTGNEGDVELGEVLLALARRPEVEVLLAYVEGLRGRDAFLAALREARARRKPVLVMKVGRTAAGAQAVASHTASLAGEDAVYDAVLRQHGAYRARTTEELIDVAQALRLRRWPAGPRLCVVTTSGGIGAQVADFASDFGLVLAEVPAVTQAALRELAPHAATRNPVDLTGQILNDLALMARSVELLLQADAFDAVYVFVGLVAADARIGPVLLEGLGAVKQRHPDRLVVVSLIAPREIEQRWEAAGFLVYEDPFRAIRALAALHRIGQALDAPPPAAPPQEDAPALPPLRRFNEVQAKAVLAACGIGAPPEHLVADAAQAAALALPHAVAVKVVSPDLAHKTDVGGVQLDLRDAAAVAAAVQAIGASVARQAPRSRIDGYLVSPMVRGGVECVIGVHADPVFGPVVMFGLGGVMVELLRDAVFRLAPFDLAEAHAMIRESRACTLLAGFRGQPPADIDALAQALSAVSRLAAAHAGRLATLEVNPLRVMPAGQGVLALDAVLQLRDDGA